MPANIAPDARLSGCRTLPFINPDLCILCSGFPEDARFTHATRARMRRSADAGSRVCDGDARAGLSHGRKAQSIRPRDPLEPRCDPEQAACTTYHLGPRHRRASRGAPNAASLLGLGQASPFRRAAAFARAVEAGSGIGRAEAIRALGHGGERWRRPRLRAPATPCGSGRPPRSWWRIPAAGSRMPPGGRPSPMAACGSHAGAGGDRLRCRPAGPCRADAQIVADDRGTAAGVAASRDPRRRRASSPTTPDSGAPMAGIGRRIRPMLRRGDRFCPIRRDRFAIALASCPAGEAEAAPTRLAALLEPVPRGRAPALRLGVACAPDHARDPAMLLRLAEEALAAADRATAHRAVPQRGSRRNARAGAPSAEDLIARPERPQARTAASPAPRPAGRGRRIRRHVAASRCADGTALPAGRPRRRAPSATGFRSSSTAALSNRGRLPRPAPAGAGGDPDRRRDPARRRTGSTCSRPISGPGRASQSRLIVEMPERALATPRAGAGASTP